MSLPSIVAIWLASTILSMLVAVAVLLALPPEYLREGDLSKRHWTARIVRTVVGLILVAVGIVLSVPGVPGQGILTILAGLTLIEFPGRHRLILALLGRPTIFHAVNRLRVRFNRKPFQ
jgi:integral membrane sensor domain MASE1